MTTPAVNIITKIAGELQRYLFLKDKALYQFLAAWIVGTYLAVDHFDYFGYLLFTSPDSSCGKTRALELLHELCWESSGILNDPTRAVVFHTAHTSTQLLDEIDSWPDKTDLRAVLNSGFQRGGVVQRMMKNERGNFGEVGTMEVFGPKVLAGIAEHLPLSRVTKTRVFEIQMVRQLPSERRERFSKRAREAMAQLKAEIVDWLRANEQHIAAVYESENFAYLDGFTDRTIDITRPLAAILEVASPGVDARRMLLGVIPTLRKDETSDHSLLLLEKLKECCDGEDLVGSASELAARINPNLSEPLSEHEIGQTLRRFGFEPKSVKVAGIPRYRYVIPPSALGDVLSRYYPDVR